MEQIIITHLSGETTLLNSKEQGSYITRASQNVELLGADTVDISVDSATKLQFYIGDKIHIYGRDYTLNIAPTEKKRADNRFTYDLQFEGVQYDMLRATYSVNVDTTSNAIQDLNGDSLTGDLKRFLDVLISNLNRVFPNKWYLGTYPATTETRTETFSDTDNCLSVLQSLFSEDKYNTEFNISIAADGKRTLNVGASGTLHTYTFEHGKGRGIYELSRQKVSSSNIVTRLSVYGSSKNIMTTKYRAFKLCLPGKTKSQSYLESAAGIAAYGVWEQTKNFEDVYPHRVGVVTALGSDELTFIDNTTGLNAMFDLNEKEADGVTTKYLIAGTSAKVHFNTGNLAGYDFEIESYNHSTKTFRIKSFTDENGYVFPSKDSEAFQMQASDEYALVDIYMPQSYVDAAEAELLAKGNEYLAKYGQPLVSYGLTLDEMFLRELFGGEVGANIIWAGDYIPIKDTDIDVDKTIRVKGFTRDLLRDCAYTVTIADLPVAVSMISRVVGELKNLDNVVKMNNLNDPARARRNYLAAQEVLSMVFDPEGGFYTEKIKPMSIDTTMLSVGAKSMQFGLDGTVFQPNFGGGVSNKNRVKYTGGSLVHYAILDGENPRVWNITDGDVTVTTDAAYYVYAKCARVGTGAVILFSTSKILVESDGAYYHFLIGVLNSVDTNNARALSLMYGFTTVNGRFIKTGRIQSADGNTYFDLDAGEFKGVFKFTNGTSIQTAVTDAQTAASNAQTAAGTAQTAANTAQTAAGTAQTTANTASTNAANALATANSVAENIEAGKILYEDPMFKSGMNSTNVYNNEGNGNVLHARVAKPTDAPTQSTHILRISNIGYASPGLGGFYFATISRANAVLVTKIIAKIPVGYNISFASNAIGDNNRNGWLTANVGTGKYETYIYRVTCGSYGTFSSTNFFYFNGTAGTPSVPVTFDVAFCTVYDLTDFVLYDNTQTTINGGLVTSGTLQVAGDNSYILAGITGAGSAGTDVRFWAGASFANRATAPFRVTQEGKMYASNAEISGKIETSQFKSTGSFVTPAVDLGVGSYSTYTLTDNDMKTKSFINIVLSGGPGTQGGIKLPDAASYDGYHCTITLKVGAYLAIMNSSSTVVGSLYNSFSTGNRSVSITSIGGEWMFSYIGARTIVYSSYDSSTGRWYREYTDGWKEQGGRSTVSGSQTINLVSAFTNSNYTVHVNTIRSSPGSSGYNNVFSMTTTSFYAVIDGGNGLTWSAMGY